MSGMLVCSRFDRYLTLLRYAHNVLQKAISKGRKLTVATCGERGKWSKCGDLYWRGEVVVDYVDGRVYSAVLTVEVAHGSRGGGADIALQLFLMFDSDGNLSQDTHIVVGRHGSGLALRHVECVEHVLKELEKRIVMT